MLTTFRVITHVLLFVLAVVIFFLGLGVGLVLNSTLGSILWIVAGGIAVLNLIWIVKGMGAN